MCFQLKPFLFIDENNQEGTGSGGHNGGGQGGSGGHHNHEKYIKNSTIQSTLYNTSLN